MDKKGQVAVFIIIGVLLLLLIGILGYINYLGRDFERERPIIEEVPLEMQPIRLFIQGCVDKVSAQAFRKVGEHGGYMDPEDFLYSERYFFRDDENPTESDGIALAGEMLWQPYWLYMKTPNTCTACTMSTDNIPDLSLIHRQVQRYILEELPYCFHGFDQFTPQGFSFEELPGQDVTVEYGEKTIVDVVYPLEITIDNRVTRISRFTTVLPFNFVRLYTTAISLVSSLYINQFIENAALHIIGAYAGLNSYLPPISEHVEGDVQEMTWQMPWVQMNLQELLVSYMNILQVNGSDGAVPPESGILLPFYLDAFNDTSAIEDYSVDFFYLDWPMHFDITPRSGDELFPEYFEGPSLFSIFEGDNVFKYRFFYDVSFPIIIRIRQDGIDFPSQQESNIDFYFAYEANVRDNLDLVTFLLGQGRVLWDYKAIDIDNSGFEAEFDAKMGEVSEGEDTGATGEALSAGDTLLCNRNQWNSVNITFYTYDKYTDEPLEDVKMTFGCGKYMLCPMRGALTKYNPIRGLSYYSSKYPFCRGDAFIEFKKEGYLTQRKLFRTDISEDVGIDFHMEPLFNLVMGDPIIVNASNISQPSYELEEGQRAEILMRLIVDETDPYAPRLKNAVQIDPLQPDLPRNFSMVPGEWRIEAKLIDDDGFYIDVTRRCDCGSDDDAEENRRICELELEQAPLYPLPPSCKVTKEIEIVNEETGTTRSYDACNCSDAFNNTIASDQNECEEIVEEEMIAVFNMTNQCNIVQPYAINYTQVIPAEIGGVYFFGEGDSDSITANPWTLKNVNGLQLRLLEFEMPENDRELDKMDIRKKFKDENWNFYARPRWI